MSVEKLLQKFTNASYRAQMETEVFHIFLNRIRYVFFDEIVAKMWYLCQYFLAWFSHWSSEKITDYFFFPSLCIVPLSKFSKSFKCDCFLYGFIQWLKLQSFGIILWLFSLAHDLFHFSLIIMIKIVSLLGSIILFY